MDGAGKNRRIVLVQWKRFAGTDIDVFSSLKGFCDSYPEYNYNTLNNYLSKKKIPFENDEVKIERQLLIHKVERPNLPKFLFWEFDYEKMDWQRGYLTVMERVIENGDQNHWEEMVRFYGLKKVLKALREEITYLSNHGVAAVYKYFHLSKQELKCYSKKQSQKEHWI